jgi:hypothetical protein
VEEIMSAGDFETTDNNQDLARRCRLALEKSYGANIPLPKCIGK